MTPSFSQRKGLKPIKSVVQIKSMDDDLRNGLWNALDLVYWRQVNIRYDGGFRDYDRQMDSLAHSLWLRYFKLPVDTIPYLWSAALGWLRKYFFGCAWNEVYDFVEFVANFYSGTERNTRFMEFCNGILEGELSAYRFVSGKITEITSETEIAEIEESISGTDGPMRAVSAHLQTALDLLADRKAPDYRNSIKESISAIEAICKLMTGSKNAGLSDALRTIKAKIKLHPALESAFTKLYAYTSDAEGIRHALMDESSLGFEDAKFMLVSCSAFVNYLKAKSAKAG